MLFIIFIFFGVESVVGVKPSQMLGTGFFFLGVLGIVLEPPNAIIVVFGDLAYDKAMDSAEIACSIAVSIIFMFFNIGLVFCLQFFIF